MLASRRATAQITWYVISTWAAVAFVLCAWTPGLASSPVAAQGGAVVVLEVRGVIDPIVARYVERGIDVADRTGASLVIMRLDTPGGLDSAMRQIVQAMLNSHVPVAVFIAPSGARAGSAGVFIAMAAHIAAMAPGTNIGAAHPVDVSGGELPATVQDKLTNDAAVYIRAIAQQRGRNADWAEEAVRSSASLTAQEALAGRVIDFVADDLTVLLHVIDGYRVAVAGQEITVQIEGSPSEAYPMTWLEVIAHGIVEPNIAYILLSLGTLALIAEFYNPGAILPGATGVIALILAFVALGSLPVNWGGIALILLAFVFFIADIKVSGIALSVAGAISFVLGSLLLFSPFTPATPVMPKLSVNPWLLAGMTAFLVGFFGVAVAGGLRAQRQTALMGAQVLIGKTGSALSDLAPEGVVQVQSEMWSAVAVGEPVCAGELVEVVGWEGLRLQVRRPD